MARTKSISPLLLFGTTCLLLAAAAFVFVTKAYQETHFEIDMSDEDESEYS